MVFVKTQTQEFAGEPISFRKKTSIFLSFLSFHSFIKSLMKSNKILEIAVKVIVAALTAFLTAITTTSCAGFGPIFF